MDIEEFSELIGRKINVELHAPFKNWSAKEVESALIIMYRNKPNIKSNEIPSGFYRMVCKYYGGMKEFRSEMDIPANRKQYTYVKTEKRKQADLDKIKWTEDMLVQKAKEAAELGLTKTQFIEQNKGVNHAIIRIYGDFKDFEKLSGITFYKKPPKYDDRTLADFVHFMHNAGNSGAAAKRKDSKLYGACFKRWGSWNKALLANGYSPTRKSPRNDWTKEELAEIYLKEMISGVLSQNVSNKAAIGRLFGGMAGIQKYLGIYEEEPQYELLSKISIDCYVNQALKLDVDIISEKILDELDANLTYSIKHYYGGTADYFSQIDIDRYKKPYTTFTWTKENIVWQLERWIREGYPVNYTAIQSRHKGIIVASRRLFGSYKKAFEYAGLNYEDYRIDSAMASRQGAEFEKVVAEILADIGIEYLREPSINGCHPDFVMGKHWVDAKLSEWTVSFADCATMHKYLPHCRRLTIVYLRKLKDETVRTNELGVDLIHVSELLKELTEEKAQHYQRKLDAIMDVLKENAA